jgi:two-component system phosphate regulon sensor histidine kinase PhoR
MRRQSGTRTFYVVIEDDLTYFINTLFPQFFPPATAVLRLYELVDDRNVHRYGVPFLDSDQGSVKETFTDTLDNWVLRVADATPDPAQQRRTVLNTFVIGFAVFVILASLGVLAIAIWRERRANELKSEFITNVSHELKTPLSIISMFGEMLALGRTKSPEQAVEYAEIIWRESVRLSRLIDNVLDFSKIERGLGGYEFAEADVGDVAARAVELSQRRLAAAEMTLDAVIDPDLPPVELDANAFTLAILNLIDNAIKYAADGKRIELRVHADARRVVLSVRDWGPGIDPEEQPRVFERFYRAKSVRLKPIRGSGIGLALVQHIARAHRGDVALTSEPGHGATFTIWLPASKVAA